MNDNDIHLIVCGLPSESVVTAVQQAGLDWYLEPVAENLDQLSWFLTSDTPLIRGGAHNVLVIGEQAGPPSEIARWLLALAGAPAKDLTIVLLSDVSHPDLLAAAATLPAGRISLLPQGNDATEWVRVLTDALPGAPAGQVVTVLSGKSGVGTSSVALTVAAYVAIAGRLDRDRGPPRVCLVDFNLPVPALTAFTQSRDGLPLDLVTTPDTATVMRRGYDLVLIDTHPPHPDGENRQQPLIDAASQLLVVTDTTRTAARSTAALLQTLTRTHVFPLESVGLVWNRIHPGIDPPVAEFAALPGLRQLQHLPDTGPKHTTAINSGDLVRILWDSPDWAARIHLLAEALLGPNRVQPITPDVARLLPHLHRDGRPRTSFRLRRNPFTGRYRVR
ncbi:hypothetical protein N8J89_16725 [Crossiella sp. CA-258035]|uniref:AAA family ATPase n=1 Tax=Crossiella sp. CA-258035 TaxID=2981138 RepID=UPI0024BCE120|nr:hypothetical protein [Crossiella sp. CA-258035]WHT22643.1 hypothetical protein N8J89_16725 [Crossiella sp. CA-258035]